MAKNSIRDFDSTAANNTDIQSTDISEGCAASGINNAIRELMADIKDVSTGAVNLETPAADRLDVDNIRIDGNTISSIDTNGDINVIPNGTGEVVFHSTADSDNYVQVSSANNSEAGIRFRGDGSLGTGTDIGYEGNGNRFFISTVSGGTATEKLSMDSSGNVGIGTTTINDQLVVDSSSAEEGITVRGGGFDALKIGLVNPGTSNDGVIGMKISNALRFITNDTERMRIDNSGNLLVGTTTGGYRLVAEDTVDVVSIRMTSSSSSQQQAVQFVKNGSEVGYINCTTSSTVYGTSSDYRLKENVVDMSGAIDRVKALAPKRFNFIVDPDTTVDGFLAHEAMTVVPEAISGTHNEVDDDGNAVMQGIDQSKLVPLLTGALKEAIAKIETLETKVAALEAAE